MKMRIDRMNKIKAVAKGLVLFLRYASKAAKLSAKLSHTAKLRHPLSVGKR